MFMFMLSQVKFYLFGLLKFYPSFYIIMLWNVYVKLSEIKLKETF